MKDDAPNTKLLIKVVGTDYRKYLNAHLKFSAMPKVRNPSPKRKGKHKNAMGVNWDQDALLFFLARDLFFVVFDSWSSGPAPFADISSLHGSK
jgi:hypothetical protein